MPRLSCFALAASIAGALPLTAKADVVLSSNDGHTVMDAQKTLVAPNPVGADTVTVIDVSSDPPAIKATFDAPGSVVGPPGAIWISPDESWGIVTAATKADASAKPSGIAPDNRVAVFDLTSSPPKIVQSLTAGPRGAAGAGGPHRQLGAVAH